MEPFPLGTFPLKLANPSPRKYSTSSFLTPPQLYIPTTDNVKEAKNNSNNNNNEEEEEKEDSLDSGSEKDPSSTILGDFFNELDFSNNNYVSLEDLRTIQRTFGKEVISDTLQDEIRKTISDIKPENTNLSFSKFKSIIIQSCKNVGPRVLEHMLEEFIGGAVRVLYDAINNNGDGDELMHISNFLLALENEGIKKSDPRIATVMKNLRQLGGVKESLTLPQFANILRSNSLIAESLKHNLVIPDFIDFVKGVNDLYNIVIKNLKGENADYISTLAEVDSKLFGVGLCSVSGQQWSVGDANRLFCLQSCAKPLIYATALDELGEEKVHQHIGQEPSGQRFNNLSMNEDGLPHNSLINAGAIMACALVTAGKEPSKAFSNLMKIFAKAAGFQIGRKVGFDNPTYLAERASSDKNFCLGYMMQGNDAFPEGTDLLSCLEFYFQTCSIELTTEDLAVVAATLANGGICPITGKKVFSSKAVRNTLSVMFSCGMYDYSGQWAFKVGLPAKSGVSGAVMVVCPGVCGFVAFSPRLDKYGNSVRAVDFFRRVVDKYTLHVYDSKNTTDVSEEEDTIKIDPTVSSEISSSHNIFELLMAASTGDIVGIRKEIQFGTNVDAANYDQRTAIHLAADSGRVNVVVLLISLGATINLRDRFGFTPLDCAYRSNSSRCIRLIIEAGGKREVDLALHHQVVTQNSMFEQSLLDEGSITPNSVLTRSLDLNVNLSGGSSNSSILNFDDDMGL